MKARAIIAPAIAKLTMVSKASIIAIIVEVPLREGRETAH
jgi:hypothetical protein